MVTTVSFGTMTRLRDAMSVYGHAMPCNLKGTLYGVCVFTPIDFEAQGVTMPISRGGPPILTE